MNIDREQAALKAYIRLLASQGMSPRVLVQREFIILRLSSFLKGLPVKGSQYRQAVDQFVASIEPAEIPAVLPVVREFFSFWIMDIKAIAAMNQAQVFKGAPPLAAATQDELFQIWYELDDTALSSQELKMMTAFKQLCTERDYDATIMKERTRMAQYLLVSLRGVKHKQSHSYRQVVDRNLPLFSALGSKHTYLSVAREFYDAWRGSETESITAKKTVEMALAA